MSSFYGGPRGKDFEIVKIFRNKTEMEADLSMRWQSPIGVADLVMIAYGLPGDQLTESGQNLYDINKEIDLNKYHKNYNSTIWQKIYTEENLKSTDELRGIEEFYLSGLYGLGYRLIASMVGNTPKLSVDPTDVLDADQPPNVTLDISNPDKPIFTFHLPQSQVFGEALTQVQAPTVDPEVIQCPPSSNPSITNDINHPRLLFKLPRSAKFKFGTLLGKRADKVYQLPISTNPSIADLDRGDYYINEPNGFVYLVTNKQGDIMTFEYVACLQAPHPTTTTSFKDPYTPNGLSKTPVEVTSSYVDDTERTGWNIHFKIPELPDFVVANKTDITIPYGQPGTVTIKPINSRQVEFDFRIPQGPPGDALKIKDSFIFPSDQYPTIQDTLPAISQAIEELLGDENLPDPDELISVNYIIDDNNQLSYWYSYNKDTDKWSRVLLTGGVGGLFDNAYNSNDDTYKGYSVNYINSLIGDIRLDDNGNEIYPEAVELQAYSKYQIHELFGWNEVE